MRTFREWLQHKLTEASFNYTLQRPGGDLEVTVKGDYHKASYGRRSSLGVPEEPDEPEEFEINTVIDNATGEQVDLTDKEHEELVHAFFHPEGQRKRRPPKANKSQYPSDAWKHWPKPTGIDDNSRGTDNVGGLEKSDADF